MKKHITLLMVLLLATFSSFAQEQLDDNEVYKIVDQMPQYPGGKDSLMAYMGKIEYPKEAYDAGKQGSVYIEFIIEKDGKASGFKVMRSSNHTELDDAAIEHISNMPNWTPGSIDGDPKRVAYILPVKFKLPEPETDEKPKGPGKKRKRK